MKPQALRRLSDSRLRRLTLALWVLAVGILAFPNACGLGSRIPNQDAAAIARGNAFVATADNPSAMYYNPAGITQLEGHNLQLGSLVYLNIYADYRAPGGGTEVDNKEAILPVPQIHYAYAPTNLPLAFGLGVYAPFGLGMDWPSDAPFRTSGIEAQLTHLSINPVVAWKPLKTLSLAVGPTFNYGRAKLRLGLQPPPGTAQYEFVGYDWSYGFDAGLLWQPSPKWSLGAKYYSASTMAYEGDGTADAPFGVISGPTTTHLDFPQIIVAGISFRPTTNWNFEFNVDWTDWNTTDLAAVDGVGALPLYWNSSFFYEIGATRQLGKGYYASVGYFFSEPSTPEAFYTPLVPDTDLHIGSFGGGYQGEHLTWAVAIQIIGGPYRDIDNQVADPSVNGSYKLFTPTISFSVGYRF